MGIFARLLGKQVENVHDAATTALINADPESALEVDREALQAQLQKLSFEVVTAKQKLAKEIEEQKLAEVLVEQELKAARILLGKGDEASKVSAAKLLGKIEADKTRLEQEAADVVEAQKALDEWQSALDEVHSRFENFQREADTTMRQLDLAKAQKQHADADQERQELLKGFTAHHGVNSALGALKQNAQKMSAQAEAQRSLVEMSRPATDKDAGIQAALKEAAGLPTNESLEEQLARLSK
jgi:hypothetical protein